MHNTIINEEFYNLDKNTGIGIYVLNLSCNKCGKSESHSLSNIMNYTVERDIIDRFKKQPCEDIDNA
jgi:hypothetical protein